MKSLCIGLFVLFYQSLALADDLIIVDARRNIPLSDEEPIYKDYYLNGGESDGLKKNLVVNVVRRLTIRDFAGAQVIGEIEVPVGQLRILAVFGHVAVAREYKMFSRDENPMLEQVGLMIGDRIDPRGAFVDSKPMPAAKRKIVEITPPGRTTAAVLHAVVTDTVAAPAGVPQEFVKPVDSPETAKKPLPELPSAPKNPTGS